MAPWHGSRDWRTCDLETRSRLAAGDLDPELVADWIALARHREKWSDELRLYRHMLSRGRLRGIPLAAFAELQRKAWRVARRRRARRGRGLRIAVYIWSEWFGNTCASVVEAAKAAGHRVETATAIDAVAGFGPDVVLSPFAPLDDTIALRRALADVPLVYLRHGFASKRISIQNAANFDIVCVSSCEVGRDFEERGFIDPRAIWVTGYPQLDQLASGPHAVASEPRTVLFAPTYNPRLTSLDWLTPECLARLLDGQPSLRLIVKLHPETYRNSRGSWETWRAAVEPMKGADFVSDPFADLVPLFAKADLLVSDFSSAAFAFLATGRPIVLVTPPGAAGDHPDYDAHGIEWRWRDMADGVTAPDAFVPTVLRVLANPAQRAENRARYRDRLFGATLDGRSGARVIARVEAMFGG